MSKESYFAQYVSPNIVIVPTESFSPPSTEKKDVFTTSNGLINSEQNVINYTTTPGSNIVVNTNFIMEARSANISENVTNSPSATQNYIPTDISSTNMSHGIKEVSASKYKSRNNLVDLTGFNTLKRDSVHKDSRHRNESNIGDDIVKITDKIKYVKYPDSDDTYYTENKYNKESLNGSNEARRSINCEGISKDSISKRNAIDMEDKMKKYFKQLWRSNVEKIKDKSSKECPDRDFKSNRTKTNYKDSKLELSRSKIKLKKDTNTGTTKYSRNRSEHTSKEYSDFERRFRAEYVSRSKSETKSSTSADTTRSITDREKYLSSIAMKRYKDFQNFIRHHKDDDSKHKTARKNNTESLHNKTQVLSNKTTVNESKVKQVVENKQSLKTVQHRKSNTNLNSTEKTKTKKVPDNASKTKCDSEKNDLRSRLSRKRTRSECLSHSKDIRNQNADETLMITVEQEVKKDRKIPKKLAPTVKKPKTKKCKRIKLVINIECENSADSDDSDRNFDGTSPQDLSFLDDFNIDEIVDSLNSNNSPVGNNKMSATEKKSYTNEETKIKASLMNDLNLKVKQLKKENGEINKSLEEQVIFIESDSDDEASNLETRSVINSSKDKAGNSKPNVDIVKTIEQKECVDLCDDSDESIQEIMDYINENNHCVAPTDSLATHDVTICESNKDDENKDQLHELSTKLNKNDQERIKAAIKNPLGTVKNNTTQKVNIMQDTASLTAPSQNINAKSKDILQKPAHRTRTYPVSVENDNKKKVTNNPELLTKSNRNINTAKLTSQKSKDPIEASLETMFENVQKDTKGNTAMDIELSNGQIKQEIDSVEKSLETMFSDRKDSSNIERSNISDEYIKEEILQQSEKTCNISLETINNNTVQNHYTVLPNKTNKHIKAETVETSLEIAQNNIKPNNEKDKIKMEFVPSNIDNTIKANSEKRSQKSESTTQNAFITGKNEQKAEIQKDGVITDENIKQERKADLSHKNKGTTKTSHIPIKNKADKKAIKTITGPPNVLDKNIKEKVENHLQISKNNTNKSLGTVKHKREHKAVIRIETTPASKSDKNITENAHNQKSNDAIKNSTKTKTPTNNTNKSDKEKVISTNPQDTTINSSLTENNIIEQTVDMQMHIKTFKRAAEIIKEKAENLQNTEDVTIKSNDPIINNAEKTDTEMYTETSNISTNTEDMPKKSHEITITDAEKNADLEPSSTADKNIIQGKCVVTSNKSLETVKNNIQHITINVDSLTHYDKNVVTTIPKKSVDSPAKSLPTMNTEEDSIAKNDNIIKFEENNMEERTNNDNKKAVTINVEPSKAKELNKESTNKNNEINKRTKMDTISVTQIKQKHVDSNQNSPENTNSNIEKQTTKKVEVDSSILEPFVEKLESRMLNYFQKKFTVLSKIHNGNYSLIYKCKDAEGKIYAIKRLNHVNRQSSGIYKERMLAQLQKNTTKLTSCLLYMISGFSVHGFWCFLTDYYPKNLEQALKENKKSFHIDLVQILSRQLVAAVNMLTNNEIIHSDIKPSHILLNSTNNRLKLCGFDRSNYFHHMNMLPGTGTASYRAPELILGCTTAADYRIDVWSTAVVMFEMATSVKLFPGTFNNDILFKQLCTLGSFDFEMINNSRYRHYYFIGTSFVRRISANGKKTVLVHTLQRNDKLRTQIYRSYAKDWEGCRTRWQATEDLDKLETFHRLLEQMLVLDPQHRLPIEFVEASEFFHDMFA